MFTAPSSGEARASAVAMRRTSRSRCDVMASLPLLNKSKREIAIRPSGAVSIADGDNVAIEQRVEPAVEFGPCFVSALLRTDECQVVSLDLLKRTSVDKLNTEPCARVEVVDFGLVGRERIAASPFFEAPQDDLRCLAVTAVPGEHANPLRCCCAMNIVQSRLLSKST